MGNIANKEEIERIVREVVNEDLSNIVEKQLLEREKKFEGISIIERIIKVEQSLENTNKRLEDLIHYIDKRFEQVDKRFEQVDKRFEQVDKRFEQVDKRFEQVNKRFEQIDKRFEEMLNYMDKRFEDLNKRINFMSWFIPTIITIVVAVLKFM